MQEEDNLSCTCCGSCPRCWCSYAGSCPLPYWYQEQDERKRASWLKKLEAARLARLRARYGGILPGER